MNPARRLFLIAVLLCSTPQAHALNIILESFTNSTHPAIVGGTANDSGVPLAEDPPAYDPNTSGLFNILQHIESRYQDGFEDAQTIRITYLWDTNSPFSGQARPLWVVEDPNNGLITHAIIRFDPTRNWYVDATPANDSEFNMAQKLYSFGSNTLTGTEQLANFSGTVPDVFEAGYNGLADPNGPAGPNGGGNQLDLLTVAFQEVGHSLGLSSGFPGNIVTDPNGLPISGEAADSDWDVDPNFVNGVVMAMRAPGVGSNGPFAHLVGSDAVMAVSLGSNERTRPSAADFFAIAAIYGWTNIDLPRQDFLGGANWNTAGNWMGNQVPGSADAAFVRHGGTVTLSNNDLVASLLVDGDSRVITDSNELSADDVTIQRTTGASVSAIEVSSLGLLSADVLTISDNGLLFVEDGTVESREIFIADGGQLRGYGTVDLNNAVALLSNDGTIAATNGVQDLVITSLDTIPLDLDGVNENGTLEALQGDLRFDTGLFDVFNSLASVGIARELEFGGGATIGNGGSVELMGNANAPATLSGAVIFVGQGGSIVADDRGTVTATLILQTGSQVSAPLGTAHLDLNGQTTLNGGQITGSGLVIQNGPLFVDSDSLVDVSTYDMDGSNGNTIITITKATLDINSPNIETGINNSDDIYTGINDFDGTIHVNSGTLDVAPNWFLDGTINLNQTAAPVPILTGDGILTIRSGGQLNVSGLGDINQEMIIEGGVFVGIKGGEANFNQITSFTSTAMVETNGTGDAIDLNGMTTMAGGSYTGNGAIKFDNRVFITKDTSIGMADTDLDGDSGNAEINVQPNVTFSVFSSKLELSVNDGFDGVMNLEGTFSSTVLFRLDGSLNMTQSAGDPPPTLNGPSGFTIFSSGEMNTDGDAIVNRDTTVQGDMNIGQGVTQINGTASFESTAVVTVAAGGELELNGATTLLGGSYTGAGLIQLNATTMVDAATAIATDRIDLDGAGENTQIMVNDTSFVLNVNRIDVMNNRFAGTMDVTGNSALLEVNLSNPLTAWTLSPAGTMNFDTTSVSPVTMLDGSDLAAEGAITADGQVRLGVNVGLSGSLSTADATTDVHFDGGGRSFIFDTAMLSGLGQMTIDNGSTMNLENGAMVGIDVENAGRLEIGFFDSGVSIDVIEPGAATIRGDFAQTTDGEFAVDLGGLTQATKYNWLDIIGPATLTGTIEVQLIDNFQPSVGDMFRVLTATSVINTFDTIVTIDETNMFGFEVTAIYSATDVVLQIDDVFLSADFDHDDDVDGNDFLIWQAGLGLTMEVDNTNGDANGDGLVNAEDLSIWENQYGSVFSPLVAAASVPEPSGGVLLILGAISLLRRRCQHKLDRSPSMFRRSTRG